MQCHANARIQITETEHGKNNISLVVVLVAQSRALGVENIPKAHIRAETVNVDSGVESESVAATVSAADGGDAGVTAVVLPDAEVAVDECVVQEKDGVGGGRVCVLHDRSDTIVAPGVSTAFGARCHIGVGGTGVTGVDDSVASVDGP
jgi:hypothetical protein